MERAFLIVVAGSSRQGIWIRMCIYTSNLDAAGGVGISNKKGPGKTGAFDISELKTDQRE
jgi:hypothetical protein